jgi:hypothetical protein
LLGTSIQKLSFEFKLKKLGRVTGASGKLAGSGETVEGEKTGDGTNSNIPSRRIVLLYLAHCGLGHKRLLHVLLEGSDF